MNMNLSSIQVLYKVGVVVAAVEGNGVCMSMITRVLVRKCQIILSARHT